MDPPKFANKRKSDAALCNVNRWKTTMTTGGYRGERETIAVVKFRAAPSLIIAGATMRSLRFKCEMCCSARSVCSCY